MWTWAAICADTKLVPSWIIGKKELITAKVFIADLASGLSNRVQLTTDGHRPYLEAVESAFGSEIDFAQLIKLYGADPEPEKRYSRAKCIGAESWVVTGNPNLSYISTSYAERQNLIMGMSMRRFTRLTNAFSKKVENLAAAESLHFMYYNFARTHKTLSKKHPTTPAMAAGVSDHVWSVAEIAGLLNSSESKWPTTAVPTA